MSIFPRSFVTLLWRDFQRLLSFFFFMAPESAYIPSFSRRWDGEVWRDIFDKHGLTGH